MNIVEIKNVSKKYDDNTILDNISLRIKKGEFVIILGQSGSGKSTLLHILGGIETVTNGMVKINQREISKLKYDELANFRAKNIGIIYQGYNLLPNLNIKENIILPTYISGRNKYDLKRIVNILKIDDILDKMPSQISGGQAQRTAVARALINEPKIILADEPTGNLDYNNTKELMKLFCFYNRLGQTIIMVTHDESLLKYATMVVRLKNGKLSFDRKNCKKHMPRQ